MENVRKRSKIKIVNGSDTKNSKKLTAKSCNRGSHIFDNSVCENG